MFICITVYIYIHVANQRVQNLRISEKFYQIIFVVPHYVNFINILFNPRGIQSN